MKNSGPSRGFTLMELLVVMSIIGIFALGVSNINFSRMNQKQQLEIQTQEIISRLEEIRNNTLIGKAVDDGSGLENPEAWHSEIDSPSSTYPQGHIGTSYTLQSGTKKSYLEDIIPQFPYEISSITCYGPDFQDESNTSSVALIYKGDTMSVESGCSGTANPQIIEFNYSISGLSNTITLSLLTGVISSHASTP